MRKNAKAVAAANAPQSAGRRKRVLETLLLISSLSALIWTLVTRIGGRVLRGANGIEQDQLAEKHPTRGLDVNAPPVIPHPRIGEEVEHDPASRPSRSWRRRGLRILSTILLVSGVTVVAWTLLVWQWQEPFTSVYTKLKQHQLAESYERQVADFIPQPVRRPKATRRPSAAQLRAAELSALRSTAGRYRVHARAGAAIGRIRVPRLGLNMILVNGTDHDSLKRGPGRDPHSYMPGEGQLVYVAGHRTTYLAPFARIDELRRGDPVTIETPYATFRYRITRHIIVKANAIQVLRSPGYELLALQACHPRFFATHRYIAYAIPVRVIPRGGRPLNLNKREFARVD